MQFSNTLDLVDVAVSQQQFRIREAARAARRCHVYDEEVIGGRSLRVWIGDHVVAWGQSIRGGVPSRPTVAAGRMPNRALLAQHEPVQSH